jgi:aspartyl-tRNA(Asn)/glutamyl-tRNA(Gln) amidotransferase subunit B
MDYQIFIGLEIHIQLLTKTKIFCGCPNRFGDEPNTNICPVCLGYPGVLPSLNEEAVKKSYLVARALNCRLSEKAVFERKNYFYPDMPKNYQITQYASPCGLGGTMDIELAEGKLKTLHFHDVHLEEDAGKMIHTPFQSRLDYNRAGTPLLEIVTEPDLESGEEAELFLQQFQRMVRYLGVTDANMEEGSMRCDANISLNERGKGLGRKVEIKNLNSSRFVKKALEYEAKRQARILKSGGTVEQETRLWDEGQNRSASMRSKENAHDYRYFPEPDLPPFAPGPEFLAGVDALMVELPLARKHRLREAHGLNDQQLDFLIAEKAAADFFESTVKAGAPAPAAASWLGSDIQKLLNREGLTLDASPLTPQRLADLVNLVESDRISNKMGKEVLEILFQEDKDPESIVRERGMEQVADQGELEAVVNQVFTAHPQVVEAVRAGEQRQIGFLMGQIMKATGGSANPKIAQKIIQEKLEAGR